MHPSRARPLRRAAGRGVRKAGSPRWAVLSALVSTGKPSTAGARIEPAHSTRRCATNACGGNSSPARWATQTCAYSRRGGALPLSRGGHAGRAPGPKAAAPAQPRLALVFHEPARRQPSEETARVGSCLLFSVPTFPLSRALGTAQCRPPPLTRPACPLLVRVKSLIPLPPRTGAAPCQGGLPSALAALFERDSGTPEVGARSPLGRPRPPGSATRRSHGHPGSSKFPSGWGEALALGWGGIL